MRSATLAAALGVAVLGACAGRDPQPIATAQVQDTYATCVQLTAEIEANNIKVKQLADEQGLKVAQNVGAGVAGLILWPIWFGMDFKDAAGKEVVALQARQQYLAALAAGRHHRDDIGKRSAIDVEATGRAAALNEREHRVLVA